MKNITILVALVAMLGHALAPSVRGQNPGYAGNPAATNGRWFSCSKCGLKHYKNMNPGDSCERCRTRFVMPTVAAVPPVPAASGHARAGNRSRVPQASGLGAARGYPQQQPAYQQPQTAYPQQPVVYQQPAVYQQPVYQQTPQVIYQQPIVQQPTVVYRRCSRGHTYSGSSCNSCRYQHQRVYVAPQYCAPSSQLRTTSSYRRCGRCGANYSGSRCGRCGSGSSYYGGYNGSGSSGSVDWGVTWGGQTKKMGTVRSF